MTRVDDSVNKIKSMIFNKEYDENGFLPSEGELTEILSVSRATVREAVRTLEVRGFLQRIHGKGIKVVDKGVKVMTQSMHDLFEKEDLTLDDVLEVRWIIETKAAVLAVQRATEEEIEELLKSIEIMEKCDGIDSLYIQCDFEFHQKLVACSKNNMLISITCAYSELLIELIEVSSKTEVNLENQYHYHRNIYNALKKRDEKEIQRYMKEHLAATMANKMSNA